MAPSPKVIDNMSDEEDVFITGKKKPVKNLFQDSDDDNIANSTHLEKSNGHNFNSDDESANTRVENGEADKNSDLRSMQQSESNTSDEEENIFLTRKKKPNMTIMEDSDDEKSVTRENEDSLVNSRETILNNDENSTGSASETFKKKILTKRSVIRPENDDSESDLSDDGDNAKSGRIQDRRNKLTEKFKKMLGKKKFYKADDENKDTGETTIEHTVKPKSTIDNLYDSEESDNDAEASYQADTEIISKKQKSHIHPSPKVQRMSAKQAMENMHMIKSESNRMLREKQISLPYHRPRQITLKEIMEKRRPILGLGGKQLRVKMNEEQLREYALQLEERQKKNYRAL